jgi:hypothetical protein
MISNLIPLNKERSTTVTIRVDEHLREQLLRTAKENERSVGAEVRVAAAVTTGHSYGRWEPFTLVAASSRACSAQQRGSEAR